MNDLDARNRSPRLAAAGAALLLGLAIVKASTGPLLAGPAQQGGDLSCTWTTAGTPSSELFDSGAGYDPARNRMYVYGGLDGRFAASNRFEELTMTGQPGAPTVSHRLVNTSARDLFGPACAFRDRGADSPDSALYCISGNDDPDDDDMSTAVQRYTPSTGAWEASVPASGSFLGRWGAAAAYDPEHDVIIVVGGVTSCKLTEIIAGEGCQARPIATNVLSFAGGLKWSALPGNESIFDHSMVYDSVARRMLIVGGTTNGRDGASYLKQIDLSGPDLLTARVTVLAASGTGPAALGAAAAFDAGVNALVTYGGVTRNYLQSSEASENKTMLLDLSVEPPRWVNLAGVTLQDRIHGAMAYDSLQRATLFTLGRKTVGQDPMRPAMIRVTNALSCERAGGTPSPTPLTMTPPAPTDPPSATHTPTTAAPSPPPPTTPAPPTSPSPTPTPGTPSATPPTPTPTATPTASALTPTIPPTALPPTTAVPTPTTTPSGTPPATPHPILLPLALQGHDLDTSTPVGRPTRDPRTPSPPPAAHCRPPLERCAPCPGCTPTVVGAHTPTVCPICRP